MKLFARILEKVISLFSKKYDEVPEWLRGNRVIRYFTEEGEARYWNCTQFEPNQVPEDAAIVTFIRGRGIMNVTVNFENTLHIASGKIAFLGGIDTYGAMWALLRHINVSKYLVQGSSENDYDVSHLSNIDCLLEEPEKGWFLFEISKLN